MSLRTRLAHVATQFLSPRSITPSTVPSMTSLLAPTTHASPAPQVDIHALTATFIGAADWTELRRVHRALGEPAPVDAPDPIADTWLSGFTSREEYVAWRAAWRSAYAAIATRIRTERAQLVTAQRGGQYQAANQALAARAVAQGIARRLLDVRAASKRRAGGLRASRLHQVTGP